MTTIYIVGMGGTRGEFTPKKAFKLKTKAKEFQDKLYSESGNMSPYFWTTREVELV